MKQKNYEQRAYASEVTAGENEIVGNPVVCGVRTQMRDYIEVIEPGALVEADISDVLFTVNHNINDIPLARSKGGQPGETMHLTVDNYNCKIAAQLDVENNPQARALHSAVAREDITG
ncbi:MAG: HK97 family phage prohead protease, partial [Roseburia sp.]|nr:HK97 family phage prohead protease [Roseburia sp.]